MLYFINNARSGEGFIEGGSVLSGEYRSLTSQYNGYYGVQTDPNGLLYMRARYYSPTLRRFLNADPIGFAGGMNWYQYANGNPISYVDPSGNVAWLLAAPLVYWGSTQYANAPGPNDPTFNGAPFADEALVAGAVGPAIAVGRTIVGSSMTAGRGFINTLTGPATSEAVREAGTIGFAEATAATGTLARTTSAAATSASRKLASKAISSYTTYAALTGMGGAILGFTTPSDYSSSISGNPITAPFEIGNLAGSAFSNSLGIFNAIDNKSNPPIK